MLRAPIGNFHNARLSLVQSCLREIVGRQIRGMAGPGLGAGEPVQRAATVVLEGIDRGTITDAASARAAFRAARLAQAAAAPVAAAGTVGTAGDCLDLLAEYTLAWVFDDTAEMAEVRSEFVDNTCDPGWLSAMVDWLEYYWDGQAPQYNPPSGDTPAPIPLPPPASADGTLRVGVLGDWGTGEPDAIAVLDQLMQEAPDVILHVGDIYYAGTPDECASNFLAPINAARTKYGKPIPVYTLAGNHDYYSGGAGFYGMIAKLNEGIPNSTIQSHSFFCLRDDSWQIEGMDTGYNDHDLLAVAEDITWLRDDEAAWHAKQLAAAGSRRVILLSHHQLFSAFQAIGAAGTAYQNPYLTANLQSWSAAGTDIAAWLWGHEHLLEVYASPPVDGSGLPVLGRCIGHGAFPVFNDEGFYTPKTNTVPLAPASGFPGGFVQTGDEGLIYARGFAMLKLGSISGTATYYQVDIPNDGTAPTSRALWTDTFPSSTSAH
jgi:hypothetical protein